MIFGLVSKVRIETFALAYRSTVVCILHLLIHCRDFWQGFALALVLPATGREPLNVARDAR